MKSAALLMLLLLSLVDAEKMRPNVNLKPTLRHLRRLLSQMRMLMWELRALKDVLQHAKYDKSFLMKTTPNLVTILPIEQDCSCEQPLNTTLISNTKITVQTVDNGTKKAPAYNSVVVLGAVSLYGSIDSRDSRCAKICSGFRSKIYNKQKRLPTIKPKMKGNKAEFIVVKGDKKDFYLWNEQTNSVNARDFCCDRGLYPAKINNTSELDWLHNAYRNIKEKRDTNIFSSGYADIKLTREFYDCLQKEYVHDKMWVTGEPDNLKGDEPYAAIWLPRDANRKAGYKDVSAFLNLYPMCELHH